jgi:secreted PhoX family phosphatase
MKVRGLQHRNQQCINHIISVMNLERREFLSTLTMAGAATLFSGNSLSGFNIPGKGQTGHCPGRAGLLQQGPACAGTTID